MAGILMFLVLSGLTLVVIYGLRRPHFWLFAALVVFVGLPFVIVLSLLGHTL